MSSVLTQSENRRNKQRATRNWKANARRKLTTVSSKVKFQTGHNENQLEKATSRESLGGHIKKQTQPAAFASGSGNQL